MICAEGRYREAAIIADGLVLRYAETGDVLAGSAGYFLCSMLRFLDGDLDAALEAVAQVDAIPLAGTETAHLMMFDIRAQGVAVWIQIVRRRVEGRGRVVLGGRLEVVHRQRGLVAETDVDVDDGRGAVAVLEFLRPLAG